MDNSIGYVQYLVEIILFILFYFIFYEIFFLITERGLQQALLSDTKPCRIGKNLIALKVSKPFPAERIRVSWDATEFVQKYYSQQTDWKVSPLAIYSLLVGDGSAFFKNWLIFVSLCSEASLNTWSLLFFFVEVRRLLFLLIILIRVCIDSFVWCVSLRYKL